MRVGLRESGGDQGRSPVKSLMLDPLCIILDVSSDPVSVSVGECERSFSASYKPIEFPRAAAERASEGSRAIVEAYSRAESHSARVGSARLVGEVWTDPNRLWHEHLARPASRPGNYQISSIQGKNTWHWYPYTDCKQNGKYYSSLLIVAAAASEADTDALSSSLACASTTQIRFSLGDLDEKANRGGRRMRQKDERDAHSTGRSRAGRGTRPNRP